MCAHSLVVEASYLKQLRELCVVPLLYVWEALQELMVCQILLSVAVCRRSDGIPCPHHGQLEHVFNHQSGAEMLLELREAGDRGWGC